MNYIGGGFSLKPILNCGFHDHSTWEIIFQALEHADITADGETYRLAKDEIIVIPPRTMHNAESDTPFIHMYFRLKECDFPTYPFTLKDADGSIGRLFNMLEISSAEKSAVNELMCEKITELICLCIKKAVSDGDCTDVVLRFKAVLTENVGNSSFRLGDYIDEMGYSPDHFRRIFKKYASCSPIEYLNRLRISRAKELLRLESYLTLDEIADRCGFCNGFYFSTVFRKHENISPSEYKKRLAEDVEYDKL